MNWDRDITKPLLLTIVAGILAGVAGVVYLLNSSGGGRDARKAEGEQLMGSARDASRVGYGKNGSCEEAEVALKSAAGGFMGSYYYVLPQLISVNQKTARIECVPKPGIEGPTGYMEFSWESGYTTVHWSDEEHP